MISWPLSIALGIIGFVLAMWLAATKMALNRISGGMVRKLELRNRTLAGKLESWLAQRDRIRIAARFAFAMVWLLLAYSFAAWLAHCELAEVSASMRWGVPAGALILFAVIPEFIDSHLSANGTARLLGWTVPFLRVPGLVIAPLAWLLTARVRRNSVHANGANDEADEATAEDEIMSLVDQSEQTVDGEKSLEDDERRMIRGVFDLDETLVREIMTPRVDVDAIEDTSRIDEVKSEIIRSGHSRLPVYQGTVDHIIGVIHAKDLLDDARTRGIASVADLCRRPLFIPESKNIGDLLNEFQQHGNHFSIVLDEYGGTAGIVTFEDIIEEIVGDIRDEYDGKPPEPSAQALPDGTVIADARLSIAELNELLDAELSEDDDYDTLGGYISAQAGRIPQAGERLVTEHLELEILAADPRRVMKAKIRKLSDAPTHPGD